MIASDFDSFVGGVLFTQTHYDPQDKTFKDLGPYDIKWQLNVGSPIFEIKNGIEGMSFDGVSGQTLKAPQLALGEITIVAIFEQQLPHGQTYAVIGDGDPSASNTWRCSLGYDSFQMFCIIGSASQKFTPGSVQMGCGSLNNLLGQASASVNNAPPSTYQIGSNKQTFGILQPNSTIGAYRETEIPFSGWLHKVLIFSEDLYLRKPEELSALLNAEMKLANIT